MTPQPHDKTVATELLVIDIGNTMVHLGAVRDGKVFDRTVVDAANADGLRAAIKALWDKLNTQQPRAAIAGSVVPDVLKCVRTVVREVLDRDLLVIRDQINLPMELAIENPDSVGVDRVCAAAAAHAQLQQACVIADFGTAITIDCVSDDGVFLGGTILPGLRLSAKALEEHTAALPLVDVVEPTNPWGRNTYEAISNGIFFGAVGALREIVERYATEMGKWPILIATGGAAAMIAKHAEFVDHVVPDLTLRGIALAYYRMFGPPASSPDE